MGGVVVIFEYQLRPEVDVEEYSQLSQRLRARVAADERFGFVDMHSVVADDGTHTVVERFNSAARMHNWATDPEHRAAQRRGREEFYAWYRVTVSDVGREYSYGSVPEVITAGASSPPPAGQ
ncbi:MAG: antibiotic biosynthesis monooxygenase [Candidatus Dormibacteraeota bacterium]|nr:antibiotic biosynthesis monooxygenase [Candidatus Dormibacteraeota bacterium]